MDKYQLLFNSLQRLQAFPLDSTSVFETEENLKEYLRTNKTAYAGQIVAVNELQNVFIIISEGDHLNFIRAGISDEKVIEIAEELDKKQYEEVIQPELQKLTDLIENLQFTIETNDNEYKKQFRSIDSRLDVIEKKIASGNIGGGGSGGSCGCIDGIPIDRDTIQSIFDEIHSDCGIVDELPVIEPIPSSKIDSIFNEINNDCSGVEDNEEIVEPIPSAIISSLFSSINNC